MSELDGQDGGRHPDEAAHARQDCFQPSAPMQQTILNALRRDVCGDLAAMMSTMQSQVEENIRDRRNVRKISGCDEEGGPDKARIGNQQSLRTAGSHCRKDPGRAARLRPGWSSFGRKLRPMVIWVPKSEKKFHETAAPARRSGSRSPLTIKLGNGLITAISLKDPACLRQSAKLRERRGSASHYRAVAPKALQSARHHDGRGFNRTALQTLKSAVFAPIPKTNVSATPAVKVGFFRNMRTA